MIQKMYPFKLRTPFEKETKRRIKHKLILFDKTVAGHLQFATNYTQQINLKYAVCA